MKNIYLGAIDNLSVSDITPWVESVKKVQNEKTDMIAMIVYRASPDVVQYLLDNKITSYMVKHDSYGNPIQHEIANSPTVSHNMRMFHFWEFLQRLDDAIDLNDNATVLITDVRDVYFQESPFSMAGFLSKDTKFIVSGECLSYGQEEWGRNNLESGFGPIFMNHSDMLIKQILNVGAIMGEFEAMKDLCHIIYSMTQGRHYPSDQSSFNVLMRTSLFKNSFMVSNKFAAHLGTTADPTKSHLWSRLTETPPIVTLDGEVLNTNSELYKIVHQWDRVPQLREKIRKS